MFVRNSFSIYIYTIALLLLTGVMPASVNGFPGEKMEGKDCSSCHTITAEEASVLLKDIVKSVENIGYARIPGLFTASVIGLDGRSGLLYIDFSKKHIISGVTVRIQDRQNISTKEMMELVRVDVSAITDENSVILGNPKASKKVYVFTDPQCPFCKKLHPELRKATQLDKDLVFYIKLMPLVNLHPDAYRISKAVMCEKSLKLLEDSFADKKIPDPTCETDAVDLTIQLARELGISSTPTLVLPDGRIAPGNRPAEKIIELVNGK